MSDLLSKTVMKWETMHRELQEEKYRVERRLEEAEKLLNKFAYPLSGRGKMSGTIWCFQIEGEIYDELRAYLDKYKGGAE